MTIELSKRSTVLMLALAAAGWAMGGEGSRAQAQADDDDLLSRERVWRDPQIPALGNPNGDLTVVEYFDYQCPICKLIHPTLSRVVREDGKVRLLSRNWPIFGNASVYAARIALAAQYQGKFAQAHEALFKAKVPLSETVIHDLLSQVGVDPEKAVSDSEIYREAIDAALARNQIQAQAFGFLGTPAFVVGPFRVSGGLDAAGFKRAFIDARKKQSKP